ncbi:MAG: TetR/AcrR family transcriptional regulator, partial [Algicola sp.]|nr:TetR/AcrR family transcriptional regulator [Algicola sp.]
MAAERNAEQTRERILQATFELMYRNGYQGMRVDQILAATGLAKGALYHHFANKQALGYAVVDELLQKEMETRWVEPLRDCEDPITAIKQVLEKATCDMTLEEMQQGCPLNNISQEMAGLDEGFQERLERIYNLWSGSIAQALERGQASGTVKALVEPAVIATFIISSLQGIIGASKCMQD